MPAVPASREPTAREVVGPLVAKWLWSLVGALEFDHDPYSPQYEPFGDQEYAESSVTSSESEESSLMIDFVSRDSSSGTDRTYQPPDSVKSEPGKLTKT